MQPSASQRLPSAIAPDQPHDIATAVRRVMRHVGSTVTIITTERKHRFGMVATAMMSLSLDPPALVVGVNRSASIHDPLLERRAFSVNVLAESDENVSRRFTSLAGEERFTAGDWRYDDEGAFRGIPYLATAQAALFCIVQQSIKSGTHTLLVGSIVEANERAAESPLLYCDGNYGAFVKSRLGVPTALDDRLALCS